MAESLNWRGIPVLAHPARNSALRLVSITNSVRLKVEGLAMACTAEKKKLQATKYYIKKQKQLGSVSLF